MSSARTTCASAVLLVCAIPASGQTGATAPREVVVEHPPVQGDSRLRLDLGDSGPRLPEALRLGAVRIDGLFQLDTARSEGGFGRTWQATAAAAFDAPGGLKISAGVIARRGYQLPLFMTTAAGSDSAIPTQGQAFATTARVPTLVDTRIGVRRRVFTGRALRVDVVAEGLNLVNANRSREASAVSETLTSRTFRMGLVFSF